MMKSTKHSGAFAIGLLICVAAGFLSGSAVAADCPPNVTGAIFTTDWLGGPVNANIYVEKEDVYLNGGPKKPGAAGLPDGWYYYQVTDPSGKSLLSNGAKKDIASRRVQVVGGEFAALEQLAPFKDSPNSGGVYKVWVTPEGCYNPADSASAFGFVPSKCKTDNFKIAGQWKDQILVVLKFLDCNGNGAWDDGEESIPWDISICDPYADVQEKIAPVLVPTYQGNWLVVESIPWDGCAGWKQTALIVDGQALPLSAGTTVAFGARSKKDEEIHTVAFGNLPVSSITACKFYDRNGNGERNWGEPPVPGIRFVLTGRDIYADPTNNLPNVNRTECTGDYGYVTFCGLYAGVYTLTEVLPPNWGATTPTAVLDAAANIEIPCTEPVKKSFDFGNVCFGTADFDTKGYWHNKNGLDEITNGDIAYVNGLAPYSSPSGCFSAGAEPFNGYFADGITAVAPAFKNDNITDGVAAGAGTPRAEISHFLVDSVSDGGSREKLAQQLLAFIMNVRHRLADGSVAVEVSGNWVAADDLIAGAIGAWSGGSDKECEDMASLLDGMNNDNEVRFISPTPCNIVYPLD